MRTPAVLKAGLLCIAAAVSAGALSVAATNTNTRTDLTLARRHQIADRTRARLAALDVPVELVVAVSRGRLDPRDADRVDDVLAALDAASDSFTVTTIDVTSPSGPDQYAALVDRLEARDDEGQAGRNAAAQSARKDAGTLQWELTSLDVAATAAAQADAANAPRLGEFAAFSRIANRQLGEILAPTETGNASEAVRTVRAIAEYAATLTPQFATMQEELTAMTVAPRARARAAESARLAATIRARTDALAAAAPPPTDLDRVAEALATGEAALLIGPPRRDGGPGLVALDLDAFYPPPAQAAMERTGEADARVRAEQLVASGLAVLTDTARPIVVFVHGEPQRWVGQAGVLTGLIERLAKAGIDFAEWPVILDESPPDLLDINPAGARPVVYAVISPDSAAASIPGNTQSTPGTARVGRVAEAVAALIERKEPVLLGMNPSVFPTFGDTDPLAALLEPFGVTARSNAPVLSTANAALGPATSWDMRIIPRIADESARADANPVAVAINGLPVAIEWPLPIETRQVEGVTTQALMTLDIEQAWSETEWLNYWRTPRAQRPLLRDPPEFTPGNEDRPGDSRGPFTVAVAIEHGVTPKGGPARIVAVGSNTWFLDRMWRSQQRIAGRGVLSNPGNPELFDAAVLWLAGREELIAPSPQARPVARIEPVSPGVLSLLRWSLIGGLPLAILALGGLWRVVRG